MGPNGESRLCRASHTIFASGFRAERPASPSWLRGLVILLICVGVLPFATTTFAHSFGYGGPSANIDVALFPDDPAIIELRRAVGSNDEDFLGFAIRFDDCPSGVFISSGDRNVEYRYREYLFDEPGPRGNVSFPVLIGNTSPDVTLAPGSIRAGGIWPAGDGQIVVSIGTRADMTFRYMTPTIPRTSWTLRNTTTHDIVDGFILLNHELRYLHGISIPAGGSITIEGQMAPEWRWCFGGMLDSATPQPVMAFDPAGLSPLHKDFYEVFQARSWYPGSGLAAAVVADIADGETHLGVDEIDPDAGWYGRGAPNPGYLSHLPPPTESSVAFDLYAFSSGQLVGTGVAEPIAHPNTLTWDGADPDEWSSAHWEPGPIAPSPHRPMVVNSGTVTVTSDLTATPANWVEIAGGGSGGTVSIAASGLLAVLGDVNVGSGGTLSIDGALAATSVNVTGGTLTSAAGGIGTASVQGNIVLTGGAGLAVDATVAGIDAIVCTGAITTDPSASLTITPLALPGPALGTAMPLITADGGLDGIFGHIDGVLQPGNLAFAVTYQPNGATVTVVTPGDFEVDGDVDFGDFTYLAANYGLSGKSWVDGDCDGNGTVEFVDFTHLAANYGSDSDSSAEAPSAGAVELHVDVTTGEMWLAGNAATLSGYSITSAAGSLVPDGDDTATPFQFYLANLAGDVSTASLGVGVLIDGELALDAAYDTAGPMDLTFSYGVFGQGGSVSLGAGNVIVVPEPTCVALLLFGGLMGLSRGRRSRCKH